MTAPRALTDSLASHYQFDRQLGAGGMATVYLAHDHKHGRDVAIKVLRPDLAETLGRERFLREIQLAARPESSAHPAGLRLGRRGRIPVLSSCP